tara:strand:- start:4244 stop:4627 length:384 start_codon:yes stop_codon:yes gene_type:complete
MEGFLKNVLFFLFFAGYVQAADKVLMVKYLNTPWGHVHQNASRYSTSLTTVSCGHPIKVYEVKADWHKVGAGPYTGYVASGQLSDKKPTCPQDKYPRFFDDLKLEITQMYYWGKLYDHYIEGKSRLK